MRIAAEEASPYVPTGASLDLADQVRLLLDREGLTPRELASRADVPYTAKELYRFMSGMALPPPPFIALITRTCRDSDGLREAYERACYATEAAAQQVETTVEPESQSESQPKPESVERRPRTAA